MHLNLRSFLRVKQYIIRQFRLRRNEVFFHMWFWRKRSCVGQTEKTCHLYIITDDTAKRGELFFALGTMIKIKHLSKLERNKSKQSTKRGRYKKYTIEKSLIGGLMLKYGLWWLWQKYNDRCQLFVYFYLGFSTGI